MNTGEAPLIPHPKKKPAMPVVNAGTTLLLAVLLVLVQVVLALLTLSSARNDYAFSRQMADKTTEYYAACNRAEATLAQLDRALAQDEQPDLEALGVEEADGTLTWSVPMGEDQALSVAVSAEDRTVLRWQVVSVRPWTGDDLLTTFQP